MSAQLMLPFSQPLTCSSAVSPAPTCPPPASAEGLVPRTPPPEAAVSGLSSTASSGRSRRAGSSSKTWPVALDGGCLSCGEPSGHGDMTACPWASPPVRLALVIGVSGSSSSADLPTLVATEGTRGPINRGDRTRSGAALREALLPTLTVYGNYNRAGAWSKSGDGLITALLPTLAARDWRTGNASAATHERWQKRPLSETLGRSAPGSGCLLDPGWCEEFMGFPLDWTAPPGALPAGPPPKSDRRASKRSETP